MQPSITDDLARPLHAIPGLLANYDGRNHSQLFNSVAAHFGELGAPDHLQQVLGRRLAAANSVILIQLSRSSV
jgi:hypothetical protein